MTRTSAAREAIETAIAVCLDLVESYEQESGDFYAANVARKCADAIRHRLLATAPEQEATYG